MGVNPAVDLAERILVLRARSGDRDAFHELVATYDSRLLYYVRRLGCGDLDVCQDVVQETWLQVFRSLGKLATPQAFRTWIYRIAYCRAMTDVRMRVHQHTSTEEIATSDGIDDWNELALLENVEFVHKALERLSPAHREVLTLRFIEDMDVKDIAEVIGCSEGTAKSRLHYAKAALRVLLEEDIHA